MTLPMTEYVFDISSPFHVQNVTHKHAESVIVSPPMMSISGTMPVPMVLMFMKP